MPANPSTHKPWEHAKASGSDSDPLAARFVESLSLDTRLYQADIQGSLAHARMLHSVGLISSADFAAIERGLTDLKREIESAPAGPTAVGVPGAWPGWKPELEDVHMCIESALTERIGDPGRRLHTGRSRNDQVAVDLRLWLRAACDQHAAALDRLLDSFISLARTQGDTLLPTYTHLQRAQPGCVGAEALAWHSMFSRDAAALRRLADDPLGLGASPLGAGAVAGSLLPINRAETAAALGFIAPALSSIDATASRDEAADFLYILARCAVHLSRLAEQWIFYCSTEFAFLRLDDAHTTGSSMMPQKRNPDMLELIRGRSAAVFGHHAAMMTLLKGLPLAYNRDLQEDKRHVFGASDLMLDCVEMAARIVAGAKFDASRITEAAGGIDRGFPDATALAEHLVTRGVPFRTAHQAVGALVRMCIERGRHALVDLPLSLMREAIAPLGIDPSALDEQSMGILKFANVVTRYRSVGHAGTGPGGYRDWLASLSAPRAAGSTAQPPFPSPLAADPTTPSSAPASLFPQPPTSKPQPPDNTEELIAAYIASGRTLDDLPYSPEFELLFGRVGQSPDASRRSILHRLHNLRKAGRLPPMGRTASAPPKVAPQVESWLRDAVIDACGSLGQRDQLPFTEKFDTLVEQVNQRTGQSLHPHEVWRLVAKIAK